LNTPVAERTLALASTSTLSLTVFWYRPVSGSAVMLPLQADSPRGNTPWTYGAGLGRQQADQLLNRVSDIAD
jgi:hypothetical protein